MEEVGSSLLFLPAGELLEPILQSNLAKSSFMATAAAYWPCRTARCDLRAEIFLSSSSRLHQSRPPDPRRQLGQRGCRPRLQRHLPDVESKTGPRVEAEGHCEPTKWRLLASPGFWHGGIGTDRRRPCTGRRCCQQILHSPGREWHVSPHPPVAVWRDGGAP